MRLRWCVLVSGDGRTYAVGDFSRPENAQAYAATLPAGTVCGLARITTTDMYRVESGHGIPPRRTPAR